MKTKIIDYFDFEKADALLEGFSESTGFVTAILDLDGNILSKSGWRRICSDFHRKNCETASNCIFSDTELARQISKDEKYHFYKCLNGLIDVGLPIVIRGEHVANFFSGQFFFEEPDISFFIKQAQKYGFDEQSYIEALKEVPVVSKEKAETVIRFFANLTQMIIEITAEKLELTELNQELKNSRADLMVTQKQLDSNLKDLKESQKVAQVGTWRLDLVTNQVFWSEELYKMYGVDSSLPPPSYTELMKLFTPESREKLSKSIDLTKTTGNPHELELETVTKDGSNGWMWVRGEAEKDLNGKITFLRGAARDITKSKKMEMGLKQSEERFRVAQEISPDGFTILHPVRNETGEIIDFTWVYENQAIALINQTDPQKIIGKRVLDIFPDHRETIIFEAYKHVANTGETQILEEVNAGEVFSKPVWLRLAIVSMGEEIAFLCQDITDRKKAENELLYLSYHDHLTGLYNRRYFEQELKNLDKPENLPLSIIMFDVNGLKLVNDSFGYDLGDSLLIKAAEAIKKACREEDIAARIGGDEFVLLLPKTTAAESLQISNHIKELASNEKVANIELSISYGYDTKKTDKQSITEIIANAENHMYRHKLYERSSIRSKITDLIMNTLFEKSDREAAHSNRVSSICQAIASKMNMGKDAVSKMKIAGLIHDIGKIGVDERILNKPGSLTVEERGYIERHPEIGWRLLSSTDEFSELAKYVLSHHENWDGTGYPNGIKGEAIPLEARIISVADAYDAMTSERSYRKMMSRDEAVKELKRCSGTQFDPEIVDVFVNQVLSEENFR
ncbi:MAG: PocR ligand-binding domain-containing protein [Bacteroidales bacterium]